MKTLLKKTLAVVLVCSLGSVANAQTRLPNLTSNQGPARGGNPIPDLIVQEFVKTGAVQKQGTKYLIPFRMKVKNVGNASTGNQFVNTIRIANKTEHAWNGSSSPLSPGATKTFHGVVKVSPIHYMGGGRTITMIAKADTEISGGNSPKTDWGKESNEFNNQKWLKVKTPGQLPIATAPNPSSNAAVSGLLQPRPTTRPATLPQARPSTRPQTRPGGTRPTTRPVTRPTRRPASRR